MAQEKETIKATSPSKLPKLPRWPTSKPGPQVTEPPPGQKRVATRREQVAEIGYNQETGEPGVLASARSEADESIQGSVSPDQVQSIQQAEETEKVQ
jgi:hypothetical protein